MNKRHGTIRNILILQTILFTFLFAFLFYGGERVSADGADAVTPESTSCRYNYMRLAEMENGARLQQVYDSIVDTLTEFYYSDVTLEKFYQAKEGAPKFYYIDEATLIAGLTDEEVKTVFYAIQMDMPIFYFISGYLQIGNDDSPTKRACPMIISKEDFANDIDNYRLGSRRKQIRSEIEQICRDVKNETDKLGTDYEKERYVADLISNMVAYNRDEMNESYSHNVVGGLERGLAVCEGYAKLNQMLLNYIGIDTTIIEGKAGESHAWNAVKIAGEWFASDLTWYDSDSDRPFEMYLNTPITFMNEDHTITDIYNYPDEGSLYIAPEMSDSSSYWVKDCYRESEFFNDFDEIKPLIREHILESISDTSNEFCIYVLSTEHINPDTLNDIALSIIDNVAGIYREDDTIELSRKSYFCNSRYYCIILTQKSSEHRWNAGVVTKEATCLEDGIKTYTCRGCHETKEEIIEKLGHNTVIDEGVEATCTAPGYTEGSHCDRCDTVFEPRVEIPALGHDFGEWQPGDDGVTYFRKCSRCDEVEYAEHLWDEGTVVKAATCTEPGTIRYTCTDCNLTKDEEIPAKGHSPVTDEAVDPTCNDYGWTAGSHCEVCNEILAAPERIDKLTHQYSDWKSDDEKHYKECELCGDISESENHTWDEGVVSAEPTYDSEGIMLYTCTVCGHFKQESIPKLIRNGWYEEDGLWYCYKDDQRVTDFDSELIEVTINGVPGVYRVVDGVIDTSFVGFVKDSSGEEKYLVDGKVFITDGVYEDPSDGAYYYVREGIKDTSFTGILVNEGGQGWYIKNGKACDGWIQTEQGWYYFDNYKMVTGWKQFGNIWYFFDQTSTKSRGVMKTGWEKIGSYSYYFAPSGAMKTGWLNDKGKWYYFSTSGVMRTGWFKDGNNWYFFQKDGSMKTGWYMDGKLYYYFTSSGAMKTGWLNDKGKWYYFSTSGAMRTGWVNDRNEWYYMDADGTMHIGWLDLAGKKYYMKADGTMAASEWVNGHYFNADGTMR